MNFLASVAVFGVLLAASPEAPLALSPPPQQAELDDQPQVVEGRSTYFMFVQTAGSGTYTPLDANEGLYEIVLEDVVPTTIYFSDRPERITGHAPMQKFLDGLGFPDENPPNAAIEVVNGDGGTDVVVAELMNPRWDEGARRLTYRIRILEDATDGGLAHYNDRKTRSLPAQFQSAAVFIDDCPDKVVYCFSRPRYANGYCGGTNDTGAYCGEIDGPPQGTCWNWATAACRLCREYFTECDAYRGKVEYPGWGMFGVPASEETPGCGDSLQCGTTFSTHRDGSHAGEVKD